MTLKERPRKLYWNHKVTLSFGNFHKEAIFIVLWKKMKEDNHQKYYIIFKINFFLNVVWCIEKGQKPDFLTKLPSP